MSDLVTLTIDGRKVSVPKGTLIVEAAKRVGIEIPVFCYHSKLEPVGACRVCLVTVGSPLRNRETGEVQVDEKGEPVIRFFPSPQPSCNTPVSPGMVVITNSEESEADRTGVLEFILTSHPLDCPVCDKGGECPLQDLTYAHGPGNSRFEYERKHTGPKKYPLGDLIVLDTERCILCYRCVRFQDEIAGDPVLAVENRGRDTLIVSYTDPGFDSKYSGNTTDICPVGALTTRDFRFGARAWELTNVPSLCNLCGAGCNTVLSTRNGEIKRVMPRQNEAVNEIWLCDKGRFGHHFNGSQDRLTTPLIKKNGQFEAASWHEALELVAAKFKAAGKAAGGIAGPHLSNEDLYTFQKLFREVIGSNNIDHRVGLNALIDDEFTHEVGAGVGTDIGRLDDKTAVLVLGADLDEESPILYLRVRSSARRGAHLINAGGRKTKLDGVAQTKLRYRYGSEAHLVWGMVAAILDESLEAKAFVAERLCGLQELSANLTGYSPEKVAQATGLTAAEIRSAAKTFAAAENGLILFGLESGGTLALQTAIRALALITGHAGRADNGIIAVLPHANSRGAADLGVLPHRLPGYVPLSEDAEPGHSAAAMLNSEGLPALYIAAADPATQSDAAKDAIEASDFVVVQDLFMTETAKLADVILPARSTAERDGTFTSVERWVQAFDVGIPATPLAWADWLIFTAVAGELGAEWSFASADGVMAEITQTVPIYNAMSFQNLTAPIPLTRQMSHYIYSGMSFMAEAREGLQWKTQAEDELSKFTLEFAVPSTEPVDGEMTLVAPRTLYDGGVLINQADVVAAHIEKPVAVISRADAKRLGVKNRASVYVAGERASVTLPVRIDRNVPPGVVLVPRNLTGSPAERLLGENPVSTVEVTKVPNLEPA